MSEDRKAIKVASECFDAAFSEGWAEALAEGDIERIRDIWKRRISFAHAILSVASTQPSTVGQDAALAVDLGQFREPIAAWSKHCAHSIKGYESYQDSDLPDWMAERRQQVRKCGELLALIDKAVGK